jgi:hypothetical protein
MGALLWEQSSRKLTTTNEVKRNCMRLVLIARILSETTGYQQTVWPEIRE